MAGAIVVLPSRQLRLKVPVFQKDFLHVGLRRRRQRRERSNALGKFHLATDDMLLHGVNLVVETGA